MSVKALVLFFILCISRVGFATEIQENYQSVRALGMGGVFIFDDSDPGVLFKNPAGLAGISGINWSVFNVNLGGGGGASLTQTATDFSNMGNVSGLNSMSSLYGKNLMVAASGYSAVALPYFGFGVIDNFSFGFRLDNPSYPNMKTKYFNDYGYQVGGAIPVGFSSFGLSFKRVSRLGGIKNIGPALLQSATSQTLQDQFTDEGVGYGFDAGMAIAPPILFNPTLSLAWMDIGATSFTKTKGSQAPPRMENNMVIGATIRGDVPLLGLAAGLEYRHINDANEPIGKKIHMGAEVSVAMFDVRAGFYQGYTTYGAGLDLLFLQLDAALYSVEKGGYAGQTQDQRVQVSLSLNLGFDPNFNLTDVGGRKRKLKQRR